MRMSTGEIIMASILRGMGVKFRYNATFHPKRKWQLDFILEPESKKVAIEVEGGTFGPQVICNHCDRPVFTITKEGRKVPIRKPGRHNSGTGYAKDCIKYTEANLLGWKLIRVTTDTLTKNPEMVENFIRRALCLQK